VISISNDTIRCYNERVVEVGRLPVFFARVPENRNSCSFGPCRMRFVNALKLIYTLESKYNATRDRSISYKSSIVFAANM
jgi:hypothetical protein